MNHARRKLRIWLLCVVTAAVLVGCIYYFGEFRGKQDVSEGTLVMAELESRV